MLLECTGRVFTTVLVLAALCGCKRQPAPGVFIDPALALLIPADAVFIAGVRVQQLEPTTFYQRYFLQGKLPIVESFAQKSGIDPRKNLWEMITCSDGKTTWVMLRGKFAEMGLEPRVSREGAQRLGYKGYTMLGDEKMSVLFLNPTTAVAASAQGLRQIIDNRDKTTGIPAWLQAKINTIPSTNQVWLVGATATGGVDLRSGVNGRIEVQTNSNADAMKLANTFREKLTDHVQVHTRGFNLEIRIDMPADRIDDLLQALPLRDWNSVTQVH